MFALGPVVRKENSKVKIAIGDASFVLILRPVTDDERLIEQGLRDRYWSEDKPDLIGKLYVARTRAMLEWIVDWEGVTNHEGVPLKFSGDNLARLLAQDGVPLRVANALIDHLIDGGAGQREKGESNASEILRAGSSADDGSTPTTSRSKSSGIPGGSQQGDLPNDSTSIMEPSAGGTLNSSTS